MTRITDLMIPRDEEPPATDTRPRWRVERPAPADLQRVLNMLDEAGYRVSEARILPVTSTAGTSVLVIAERGAR